MNWIFISGLVIIASLLIKWYKALVEYSYIKAMVANIPGPPARYTLLGNLDMIWNNCNVEQNPADYFFKSMAHLYRKEGIFKCRNANRVMVLIFNQDLAQDFLKCNVNIEKAFEYQLLYDWLGKGLLINDSAHLWRERRKLLTPAFHQKILTEFVPIFNEKTDILMKCLADCVDIKGINICDLVFPTALDIITESGMGIKINAQQNENQDYIHAIQQMGKCLLDRVFNPMLWSNVIFYMTSSGKQFKRNLNISHELTRRVINDRKDYLLQNKGNVCSDSDCKPSKRKRLAFLDLLLENHFNDNSLTLEDIREEVDTIMFAGHDTTALSLSWTLYFIGLDRDIQHRIHEEMDSILGTNRDVTIDDIKQMHYLEAVIKESLRLRPPVPTIIRAIKEDLNLGKYTIPKGVSLCLMIDSLHQDPDIYPEPLLFKPERFLSEGNSSANPFAYLPFSAGVRNCIGQKFALIELKIVLAKVLLNYSFESLDPRDRIIEYNAIVSKPKGGLRVRVSHRSGV